MKYIISCILGLYVFLSIIAFERWRELSQEKTLRELVTWAALGDHCPTIDRNSYISELLIAILNAQYNDALDPKHQITEDIEKQYVAEILNEYRQNLMRSYFKGHLHPIKSKHSLSGEDYFMLSLVDFLKDHQCEESFLGHDMRKERLVYKRYGDWGGPCYDATYSITDFSVVYHKVYLIAYLYCKNNRRINPDGNYFNSEKFIKEILDTHQIQVSRF